MLVSLYTSRVVLQTLGVEDYGIYNVVGGIVSIMAIVCGSLSNAITRFIAFELGKDNKERLHRIFCTSLIIQIFIGLIIVGLIETVGIWFLNNKVNMPAERLYAAHWVLQCSLLSFIISITSVPYNASIVAHEKMSAFAIIGLLEVILKLLVAYSLYITSSDKLIVYAVLLAVVSLVIRLSYNIYSKKHFEECKFEWMWDKSIFKEMLKFSGWNFFTNFSLITNTQGVNLLMNVYYGVVVNASRGIATQVETAILKFVNDFTTAITPQITKSYANGDYESYNKLIFRGSKFTYYLMLIMAMPLIFETEFVLSIWLGTIPDYAVIFFRLTIVSSIIDRLGNVLYVASMATGDIKRFVIYTTIISSMAFPIIWISYYIGMPAETAYVVFIFAYSISLYIKIDILGSQINIKKRDYLSNVILPLSFVTVISIIPPLILHKYQLHPLFIMLLCIISVVLSIYVAGLNNKEKTFILNIIKTKITK